MKKEDMKKIINHWNIKNFKVRYLKKSTLNLSFLILSKKEKYVLKNTRNNKRYSAAQIKVLEYLNKNNFHYKTPLPIYTKKEREGVLFDRNFFILYKYIKGKNPKRINYSLSKNIGKMLGEYHKLIINLKLRPDPTISEVFYDKKISFKIGKILKDPKVNKKLKLKLKKYFKILKKIIIKNKSKYKKLNSLISYSDINLQNILIDKRKKYKIFALIDFGRICTKPKICDIANAIKYLWGVYGKFDSRILKEFLKGYKTKNKIIKKEYELIPPLIFEETYREILWLIEKKDEYKIDKSKVKKRLDLLDWLENNNLKIS